VRVGTSGRARDASLTANHILPEWANVPMGAIRRTDVQTWVNELVAKGLAVSTVRRVYEIFDRIVTGAVDSRLIRESPCRNITLPPQRKRTKRKASAITLEEAERLAEAFEPRYRAWVPLGVWAGLRPGELAGLRSRDIDFLRGTLAVVQAVTDYRGKVGFSDLKNDNAHRTVNLSPFLVDLLSVHVRDFVGGRGAIEGFSEENVEGLLFTGGTRARPTVLRPNNFRRRAWRQAVQAAGLPSCSPKILRSTHATLMAQMGLHPAAIQARLGHADARVSQEYYIEYNQAMDAQVAASFEALYQEAIKARGPSADPGLCRRSGEEG
jgi:integrase